MSLTQEPSLDSKTITDLVESNILVVEQARQMLEYVKKHDTTLYGPTGGNGLVSDVRDLIAFRMNIQKQVDRILYPLALAGIGGLGMILWRLLLNQSPF